MLPKVVWVTLSGLLLLSGAGGPPLIAADWEGLPVRDLRHQPEEPEQAALAPAVLAEILPQKSGEPYSSQKIRESIERLYATGRFADIRVDVRQQDGGVAVVFLTKSNYFIGSVEVRGVAPPPRQGQLRTATHFELGHLFSEEEIPEALEGLRRVLEEDGYFQAQIVPSRKLHPDTQQVEIAFDVHTGQRARLGEVLFTGSPVYSPPRVIQKAKWKQGRPFTSTMMLRGLDRIRKLYQKEDYLEATVAVTARKFHPETNRVDLEVAIMAGSPVEVLVTGAPLRRSEMKRLVPIFAEGSLDDELMHEGARNLTDYFQSQGYFDAKVSYQRKDNDSGRRVVEYQVSPGLRQSLKEVRFAGNRYFSKETLREHMKIEPAGRSTSHGRFSSKLLAQDLDAIRALYQANGFAEVELTSALESSGGDSEKQTTVSIQMREGAQSRIGRFSISGNRSFPQDRLQSVIDAGSGQPYSPSLVASDRDNLLTFYFDQGFPEARFQASVTPSEDRRRVDLEYVLEEGLRKYVGQVFVEGLEHTRRGVVNRQLRFRGGEPLSQGGLLETQRRLYDLGIFNEVEVAIQNPDGRENQKNVLIHVEEARRYTMKLGLGAEVGRFGTPSRPTTNVQGTNRFSPDISFELSRLNVGGRAHTASLITRFSTLQKRAGLAYTAPRVFNREGLTASVRAFYDETFDVLTFTARRVEGSLQLENRRSRTTAFLYRYTMTRVTVDTDTLRISPALFPILARPVLVGMVNQVTIRDTRDNPADSHRGTFTSANLGIAAKQFGSQTSFGRILLQNSSYYRLGRRLVLARSSQFGVQSPFGRGRRVIIQPAETGQPAQVMVTNEIPVAEHFFSGGGNSQRGFAVNQAGPRDPETGFALGGNALLLNSVELRFPIWRESIGGVLFHDMGNVFAGISDFRLRQHQKNPQDFNYISHAVGFGLRYQTPVGPIRLDLGYNLNPTRFLIQTGGSTTSQSLTRWQFLFSIGQTF